jgi:hypothetical protein
MIDPNPRVPAYSLQYPSTEFRLIILANVGTYVHTLTLQPKPNSPYASNGRGRKFVNRLIERGEKWYDKGSQFPKEDLGPVIRDPILHKISVLYEYPTLYFHMKRESTYYVASSHCLWSTDAAGL